MTGLERSNEIAERLVRAEASLVHTASAADLERVRTEIARIETKIEAVKTWTLMRVLAAIGITTGIIVAIAAVNGAVAAWLG